MEPEQNKTGAKSTCLRLLFCQSVLHELGQIHELVAFGFN